MLVEGMCWHVMNLKVGLKLKAVPKSSVYGIQPIYLLLTCLNWLLTMQQCEGAISCAV